MRYLTSDKPESIGVSFHAPAFLDDRDQLTVAEVKESQAIAWVRIHVVRAIQRVKMYC